MPHKNPSHDIFICYRRKDARYAVGHIYRRLVDEFGAPHVFKDVDAIPLGSDFRDVLSSQIKACSVFILIIGKEWLTLKDATGRRLVDDPNDYVRIEIESALQLHIPVIPVSVDDAPMPAAEQLPSSLAPIAFSQGTTIRADPDFDRDIDRLITGIRRGTVASPDQSAPFRRSSEQAASAHEPPPTRGIWSARGAEPARRSAHAGISWPTKVAGAIAILSVVFVTSLLYFSRRQPTTSVLTDRNPPGSDTTTTIPAPAAVSYSSNFSTLGRDWTIKSGKWSVVDGALDGQSSSGGDWAAIVLNRSIANDCTVSFRTRVIGENFGELALHLASNHYVRVYLYGQGIKLGQGVFVRELDPNSPPYGSAGIGGGKTVAEQDFSFNNQMWNHITATAVGNRIIISVNGEVQIDYVDRGDQLNRSGTIGFIVNGHAQFDDLVVGKPAS